MTRRLGIFIVVCVAGLSAAVAAQPPKTTPKSAAADTSAVKRPAAKTPRAESKGIRTIDAINIEGEIAVPQVLFITSRDNRRYRDGLGKNFRTGTLEVARSLSAPNRLCVAGGSKLESLKEE